MLFGLRIAVAPALWMVSRNAANTIWPIYLKSEQFAKTGGSRQRSEFDKGDATSRPACGRRIARRFVNERLRGKLVELPICRCGSRGRAFRRRGDPTKADGFRRCFGARRMARLASGANIGAKLISDEEIHF